MTVHCERAQRARAERRGRVAYAPARIWPPVALATILQIAAAAVALLAGLPLILVVALVLAIGVVVAVGARRTVSSLVAGAGLLVARPYAPGEHVRLFVPGLKSVQDAEVVRVGPANTTLMTESGLVVVPNAMMLRGAPECRNRLDPAA